MWYTVDIMTAQEEAMKNLDKKWYQHWHSLLKNRNGSFYDTMAIRDLYNGDKLILARVGVQDDGKTDWCDEMFFIITSDGGTMQMTEARFVSL